MDNEYELAERDLFKEGLSSYIDVKIAVKAFEDLVGESCKRVMINYLENAKRVFNMPDLVESSISLWADDNRLSRVNIYAALSPPDTWGIRWGIKWSDKNPKQIEAMTCISVRLSADWKKNNLFRTLTNLSGKVSDKSINLDTTGWEHEVHIQKTLSPEYTIEVFEESLDEVISSFLDMLEEAGGLQTAILGKQQTN